MSDKHDVKAQEIKKTEEKVLAEKNVISIESIDHPIKTGFDLSGGNSQNELKGLKDNNNNKNKSNIDLSNERRESELQEFTKKGLKNRYEEWEKIFVNNKIWAQSKIDKDPNYFTRLVDIQKPDFLWIGCSDSRVPANEILGLEPGEIFVHRNIANLVLSNDLNLLSVVEFAVRILKVKHIIVCGHYGCSGVKYAYQSNDAGMLNPWITSIKDHYRHHRQELNAIEDEKERIKKYIEYNVIEGCLTLMKFCAIQKSYAEENYPIIHACVYDLSNGRLIDLDIDFINRMEAFEDIYSFKFEKKEKAISN